MDLKMKIIIATIIIIVVGITLLILWKQGVFSSSNSIPPISETRTSANKVTEVPIKTSMLNSEFNQNTAVFLSPIELELFSLVNEYRQKNNVPKLLLDSRLVLSAKKHNDLMTEKNTLSHQLPNELSLTDRYDEVGYDWKFAAENVAFGRNTAKLVMDDWINSPGHNANILSVSARDIGVAYNPIKNYWTQNFGDTFP